MGGHCGKQLSERLGCAKVLYLIARIVLLGVVGLHGRRDCAMARMILLITAPPSAQIDCVIVSCSCYAPTPSMAACLVNKFRMRRDVLTYHLAGMGCSSSLVCVDLAKRLLKVPPSYLIVLCRTAVHAQLPFPSLAEPSIPGQPSTSQFLP